MIFSQTHTHGNRSEKIEQTKQQNKKANKEKRSLEQTKQNHVRHFENYLRER